MTEQSLTCMLFCFQTGSDVLDDEVAQAGSKGFIGCFSSVQYNHVAPLKAALLNRGSSLVSIRGHLLESNCGALADLSTSVSRLGKFLEINIKIIKLFEDRKLLPLSVLYA